MALARAVRALEFVALADSLKRLLRNDMTTWHHHRRVLIRSLFFRDGAHEYRME